MTKSAPAAEHFANREVAAPAQPATAAAPAAEAAAGDATTSHADYLQQLFAPWTAMAGMWNSWLQTAEVVSRERGLESSKLLNRLWDPELWRAGGLAPLLQEMQAVFSLPRFADLPSFDLSAIKSSASMLDVMGLVQQYMAVSIPLWLQISRNFQGEMARRAEAGQAMATPGEALDVWNNVVDRTLMEFNRSGDFARLQQRLLRALTEYRLELRKLGEKSSQLLDMPTRSEMTEVYRRMHAMQRELQELRRQVRAQQRHDTPAGSSKGGS
jgi:Poly(R)-hydroxyalkanoic acid synthase subunit (PHA_synth_III_E)